MIHLSVNRRNDNRDTLILGPSLSFLNPSQINALVYILLHSDIVLFLFNIDMITGEYLPTLNHARQFTAYVFCVFLLL